MHVSHLFRMKGNRVSIGVEICYSKSGDVAIGLQRKTLFNIYLSY